MRFLGIAALLLIATACKESVKEQDLNLLNGYWEIEKVVFPDGQTREYTVNSTVDYIEYADMKGFRKKVQPKLDGTFNASDDAVLFEISTEKTTFRMHYKNDLSQWEEEIVAVGGDRMIIKTSEGVEYHYKRFKGILK
jgi:hypothetical protein